MGRCHKIIILDCEVVHRNNRQVATHRVPGLTIVERHIDADLSADVQETPSLCVFADATREVILRQVAGDGTPSRTIVRGLEQERPVVIKLVARAGQVRRCRVMWGNLDHVHAGPLFKLGRRDVLPVGAAVS